MDTQTLNQEREHLNSVLDKVISAREHLETSMNTVGSENLSKLKEIRQDRETDPADMFLFMEKLHEQNAAFNFKDKYKRLDELNYLSREPFFSRIDLADPKEGTEEKFYIGKFGYTEDSPVITDWRAKVASVYYRYRRRSLRAPIHRPDLARIHSGRC